MGQHERAGDATQQVTEVRRVSTASTDTEGIFPKDDAPEAIEPGVWCIPLPLPFALRSANVYLLDDGTGNWALVDSGLGLPADEAALRAGLAIAGLSVAQISTLILTHAHPDHIGLSGPIAAESGAEVYILAGEGQRLYDVWTPDNPAVFSAVEAMYATNGMPPDEAQRASKANRKIRSILRLPPAADMRLLEDGDELRLGRHVYHVLWTPGHSDYHMCLLREDGLFIAGDHILPSITPNIGLYPHARPDPLRDYFVALRRVRDLPVRLVLPGHRRPLTDLATRAEELRAHHEERSAFTLASLAAHPTGSHAASIAAELFGARLRTEEDRRFALAETLAHLEYLRSEERATREQRDGVFYYQPC
ncbi:MAG: MBL fold metallo-hydrolase [Ktedonobacterales bacterium]